VAAATTWTRSVSALAAAGAAGVLLCGCGARSADGTWPLPNSDLAATRAVASSAITAANVGRLRVRWRFRFTAKPGFSGIFASTPLADRRTVYVQDLRSTVFALDRSTGALRWTARFDAPNDGPNGLALDSGRVFGATDSDAFALSASSGVTLWQRHLTTPSEQLVDIAPVVWHGLVFLSTIGYEPFGRGAIYALDERTGAVRWKFVTIAHPWQHPLDAGGGGLWYPVSIDAQGRLYAGNSNPGPWGGSPKLPNGAAFPGPVPYSDSLIVLDARTGRLLWHDQVTAHDVRDQDFQATPILARINGTELVLGAGKAGRVIAWNRRTQQRVWTASVGVHRNDRGPLPRQRVTVCPGLLGGVETPMAYAESRLFVPVVDLCGWGSAVARQNVASIDPARGKGRLVALNAATGRPLWQRRLPSPNLGCATVAGNVVFTSTYGGVVYAFAVRDGSMLWQRRMGAGVNACPAVAGDMLLVGAGIRRPNGDAPELVAFGLAG
jgi:outer membrane protein assembly factor BamB